MAPRTLDERTLNRALLARQLLLERADIPLTRAIERLGGLQTQYAPAAYIALWSRLEGFERADLTRALEHRRVIQATLMRATIHMVSRRDYWPIIEAVRDARLAWWLRSTGRHAEEADLRRIDRRARRYLAAGPRRRAEIVERLGLDASSWNGVGLMSDLVRVPPSGTWEHRRADRYAVAEDWLGPSDATPDQGVALLIKRYLGGFGPASRKDIASFTGLPMSLLGPAVDRLGLRRFRDVEGGELLDVPRGPIPDPDTPAPVRFLPVWDATLLVHARRTQIVPEIYRPRIFNTKTPHSVNTFLVDGRVAGAWRFEAGGVRVEPFERLPRTIRRELDDEAERLGAFMS